MAPGSLLSGDVGAFEDVQLKDGYLPQKHIRCPTIARPGAFTTPQPLQYMRSLGTSARGGGQTSEPDDLCACRFLKVAKKRKLLDLAGSTAFAMYLAQAYPQILTARPYPAASC